MEGLMRPQSLIPTRPILFHASIFATLLAFSSMLFATPRFPNPVYKVGSNPYGMARADFNGDGIADLMVSNFGLYASIPGELSFLRGIGDGTFATQVSVPLSDEPADVFAAD